MELNDPLFDAITAALDAGREVDEITRELWDRFGETAAVLVLDSTGFTRTTQARGIAFFLTVLAQLRRIVRREFERYGVADLRTEADNIYCAFRDVDHAVAAAVAVHKALRDEPIWLGEGDPLGACIGIGHGRLLRSAQEGHYGDEMNLASKLGEDIANGGETLLTESAFTKLTHPEAFTVEDKELQISGVTVAYHALTTKR